MTTSDDTRRGHLPPIMVRPGLAVSVAVVTVLLSALTLPAAVPDRPGFAYLSGGLIGAGLLVGVLLAADLNRARAARRAGITVRGIVLGAFGSRLLLAADHPTGGGDAATAAHPFPGIGDPAGPTGRAGSAGTLPPPADPGATHPAAAGRGGVGLAAPPLPGAGPAADGQAGARIARAGLAVTILAGALLVALGVVAPGGTWALAGQVALWVGSFVLLLTFADLLPLPGSPGGRLIAARVQRRTGDPVRAEQAVARAGVVTGWSLILLGVAAFLLVGLVGLWAVLLGWMALGTSRLTQSQRRTQTALSGLAVRDVMSPAPPALSAWTPVADALDEVVLPSRRAVFGVEDFDGALAGVALLRDLAAVPMDDRGLARVNRVMIPIELVATARPDEALTEVMARLAQRPAAGCIIVVDRADGHPRMVGVVGPVEVNQAVETAPLRGQAAGPARPGGLWR